MLTDQQRSALNQWYSRPAVLARVKSLYDEQADEDLEEYLHLHCLLPLSRHDELPDYMRDDEGKTLFPSNMNPRHELEVWQDGIEVGWEVVQRELGIAHDDIHKRIAAMQEREWSTFLKRAEEHKKKS